MAVPVKSTATAAADHNFLKIITNDTKIKTATDGLYGIGLVQAAFAKWAGKTDAPQGAGSFYSRDNPLIKLLVPSFLFRDGANAPLSEPDRQRLLKISGLPDFIRSPLVAIRYGYMLLSVVKTLRHARTGVETGASDALPQERVNSYTAKMVSEAGRAAGSIIDFSASMIASGCMLMGSWNGAVGALLTSHVFRIITGVFQSGCGIFGYRDAVLEDAIAHRADAPAQQPVGKGTRHINRIASLAAFGGAATLLGITGVGFAVQTIGVTALTATGFGFMVRSTDTVHAASNNVQIRKRALDNISIAANLLTMGGIVTYNLVAHWNESSAEDMTALLKSSAASGLPLSVSYLLGTAQAAAAVRSFADAARQHRTLRDAPATAATAERLRANRSARIGNAISAVASYLYTIPMYFGVGAVLRCVSGIFDIFHFSAIARAKKLEQAVQTTNRAA